MKHQSGFTLIELVMVIVILGILSAIALPRFVDLQSDALTAAKRGMSGAVKSAHAIYIADNKTFPTVTQLATYVQGEGVGSDTGRVKVDINGTAYFVPTWSNTTCTGAGNALDTDTVQCVGSIP